MTHGEVSTILTNAEAKTRKGCLISIIDGVKSSKIIEVLSRIPLDERKNVKEVSIYMANNMEKAAKECFPNAAIVTDRFHVAKLVSDAVQHIRVGNRWNAIDEEADEIKQCREEGKSYDPEIYSNGDTKKQLLARSRYLLFKSKTKWSKSQKKRAKILFENFPSIKTAYNLSMMLRNIYETSETREYAESNYSIWKSKVLEKIKIEEKEIAAQNLKNINFEKGIKNKRRGLNLFTTVINSIESHKETILNFFTNRTTNALAECFNSKLKTFRTTFRGVRDLEFFLYRVSVIYS